MIKVLTWFKRTPGMELGDFRRYWREEHPKAVLQLPGLRKYVQNHVSDLVYRRGEPIADGVAETWWDDRDALGAHRDTAALEALMIDEAAFIDPNRRDQVLVEEVPIHNVGIPANGLKQVIFVKRKAGMDVADAMSHWRDVHGPLALKAPGLGRYVQNHPLAHQYREGRPEPTYDGATMSWFADVDAARTAGASPEMQAVIDDQPLFLDDSNILFLTCDEHHII